MEALKVNEYAVAGNSLGGNIRLPGEDGPRGAAPGPQPAAAASAPAEIPRRVIERNLRSAVGPRSGIVDEAMVDRAHALMNRPGNRPAFVDFVNTSQPDRSAEIPGIAVPALVRCAAPGSTVSTSPATSAGPGNRSTPTAGTCFRKKTRGGWRAPSRGSCDHEVLHRAR